MYPEGGAIYPNGSDLAIQTTSIVAKLDPMGSHALHTAATRVSSRRGYSGY